MKKLVVISIVSVIGFVVFLALLLHEERMLYQMIYILVMSSLFLVSYFYIPRLKNLVDVYYDKRDVKKQISQINNPISYFLAKNDLGEEYYSDLEKKREELMSLGGSAPPDHNLAYITLSYLHDKKHMLSEILNKGLPSFEEMYRGMEDYAAIFEAIDLCFENDESAELTEHFISKMFEKLEDESKDEKWGEQIVDAIAQYEVFEDISGLIIPLLAVEWGMCNVIEYVLRKYYL
jgi:hypothetical protein